MTTTTKKAGRTNTKEVKKAIQEYIINAIDVGDYPEAGSDLKSNLEFICKEFKRVAGYKHNILFHKTYQACFIDWYQGLPSYFNIETYHNEILLLMSSFGLPLPENKKEWQGIELFHSLIFREFVALCKKNGINFYDYANF